MTTLFSPAQWSNPTGSPISQSLFHNLLRAASVPYPARADNAKGGGHLPGLLRGGRHRKHIVAKVGELFVVAVIGAPITTNLFVADASMQTCC